MTFKEKLMQEHPGKDFKYVLDWECPEDYGYTDDIRCGAGGNCVDCWDREMPEGGETE